MGKKKTKLHWVSWDTLFLDDIINHDGFIITDPPTVSMDGKKERSMFGPNSPLYGSTFGDEQEYMEKYRCKCGAFKGLQFKGEECPLCHTKIESREMDIKKTGWISLGKEKIINPYWFKVFTRLIGAKPFNEIIQTMERVDKAGKRQPLIPGVDYDPKNPYACIGIDGFIEKYDEIMEYYMKKKKGKRKQFKKAIKFKKCAITSHIPVYSTALRPQSSTSDTFYYSGIDKEINPLVNLAQAIKVCEPIEKAYLQQRIQERVNNIWDFNFELINKKEGFIRNKLISGSLNYTSRCVIVPDPTLHQNEVDLSYQAFRILFKYRIIYYLMKMEDVPLAQAYYRWKNAYVFDEYVYNVMEYIIAAERPRIFLNRNPTLNLYSMLLLRIRHVKKDPYRTTLSVPLYILPGLNADQPKRSRSEGTVTCSLALREHLTSGVTFIRLLTVEVN